MKRDVITLNRPSLDKFAPSMRAGGVLVINPSMVGCRPPRRDIQALEVPASQIAEQLGTIRVVNLVALGAYVGGTRLVPPASIEAALAKVIPDSRADLRALNITAFQQGMAFTAEED